MSDIDVINRRTWRSRGSLRLYGRSAGYFDAAEKAVFHRLARDFKGCRVLDIGVGGGRTTPILQGFAGSYVGIDYTPEMVRTRRERFPDLRFMEMDARNLDVFANASFDLVVFSCNGIDSVGPEGRMAVLRECARVLAPGGIFFFSTFNRDGPGFGSRSNNRKIAWSANPVRVAYDAAKYLVGGVIGVTKIFRNAHLETPHAEHALLLHRAHDFGILVYATSIPQLRAQLSEAGFADGSEIVGCSGNPMDGHRSPTEEYFHILALKPAAH